MLGLFMAYLTTPPLSQTVNVACSVRWLAKNELESSDRHVISLSRNLPGGTEKHHESRYTGREFKPTSAEYKLLDRDIRLLFAVLKLKEIAFYFCFHAVVNKEVL
jgi:hypothetical protein